VIKNKTKCKVCLSGDLNKFIDFGVHPVSHHYLSPENQFNPNSNIPLTLCQCSICGTIQLEETADVSYYNVRFSWVRQNEPEAHLDNMVKKIISLPGINANSSIWGLSYKDESTVERFKEFGFTNTQTMDYATHIGSKEQRFNISLIQSFINERKIYEMQKTYGKPEIVICRHLLEHAHNTSVFLSAIKKLVSDGSYVILEIPECSRLITNLDYTMLWEEHITYFTESTILNAVRMNTIDIVAAEVFPYPYEDCLILILKDNEQKNKSFEVKEEINENIQNYNQYADSLKDVKEKIFSIFNKIKSNNHSVAFYGSGHIASTFINIFDLSEYIEFVIDDDENKTVLRMPGSGIPIYQCDQIDLKQIDFCFTAMSYENEQKVIKKNQEFIRNGGQLVPISPNTAYSVYDML